MADLMTFESTAPHRRPQGRLERHYNNVLSSWIDATERFGFQLDIACPKETAAAARAHRRGEAGGADVILREDPEPRSPARRR